MATPTQFVVGLRSGRVLTIADGPKIDVKDLLLSDVAFMYAAQVRSAGQLVRPSFSMAEHAVLGSYFLDDFTDALQFMFQSVGSIVTVGVNTKSGKIIADAIRDEVCKKFHVPLPINPALLNLEQTLSMYEIAKLHPAKNILMKQAGVTKEDVLAPFSEYHHQLAASFFARTAPTISEVAAEWEQRVIRLQTLIGDEVAIKNGVEKYVHKGFFPYPVALMVNRIAADLNAPVNLVQREWNRVLASGRVYQDDKFYKFRESSDVEPTTVEDSSTAAR